MAAKTPDPALNSLEFYVNNITRYLENPVNLDEIKNDSRIVNTKLHESSDLRLQYAIQNLHQALRSYPEAYEIKILEHKIALKQGDNTRATEIFNYIRERFHDHQPFKEYLAEITRSVIARSHDDNFSFFLKIPTMTQREVFLRTAIYYESTQQYLEACRMFAFVLKTYHETTFYYGIHAAQLSIECESRYQPLSVLNPYRKCLVSEILPEILRSKVIVHQTAIPSGILIYRPNSAPFISSSPLTHFHVTYHQLKIWLEYAQGFYIATKEWQNLFEVSLSIMNTCGYIKRSPRITLGDLFSEPDQLPTKLFALLGQGQIVNNPAAHAFALTIAMSCFIHCCYEFYENVAGLRRKRTCLIPYWSIRPELVAITSLSSLKIMSSFDRIASEGNLRANKKRKLSYIITVPEDNIEIVHVSSPVQTEKGKEKTRDKNVMDVKNLLVEDDNSRYPIKSSKSKEDTTFLEEYLSSEATVKETMQYLKRAETCWELMEKMISNGGKNTTRNLQQEFELQWKSWNLTLDVSNALMLTYAELNLSKGGSLDMVFNYYLDIFHRSSGAWDAHRQKAAEKERSLLSPSSSSPTSSPLPSPAKHDQQHLDISNFEQNYDAVTTDETATKVQLPLMFLFRILYSIAMIYLRFGFWKDARTDLLMILAVMPSPPVSEEHFEKDDWIHAKIQIQEFNREGSQNQYRLLEITQEGLVVKAIKDLMVTYENELKDLKSEHNNLILSHLIVLCQYGWPYWRDRIFRPIILPKIKEGGGLKYPQFLQFVNNVDVLKEFLQFYQENTDLELSLLSSESSSTTAASIKALEKKIRDYPSGLFINQSLVDFCKFTIAIERDFENNENTGSASNMGREI